MTEDAITDPVWQKNVVSILASLAVANQTITYADLADLAALPSPHRIHKLTNYLETLIAEDIGAAGPIRAAVVISKRDHGMPAEGFFDCCRTYGLAPHSCENDTAFHQRLLTTLYQSAASSE